MGQRVIRTPGGRRVIPTDSRGSATVPAQPRRYGPPTPPARPNPDARADGEVRGAGAVLTRTQRPPAPRRRTGGGDDRGPAPAASSSPRGGGRQAPSPAQRAVVARMSSSASSGFDAPPPARQNAAPRASGAQGSSASSNRRQPVTVENFNRFDNNPNRKPTVLRRAIAAREKTGLATTSFAKGERERFIARYRKTHRNNLSDAQITLIGRYLKSIGKGKALLDKKANHGTLSGGES